MKGIVLARKLWPTLMAKRIGNGSQGAIEQYQESIKDSPIKAPLLRGLADAIKAKTNEQLPILIEDDYVEGTASRLFIDSGSKLLESIFPKEESDLLIELKNNQKEENRLHFIEQKKYFNRVTLYYEKRGTNEYSNIEYEKLKSEHKSLVAEHISKERQALEKINALKKEIGKKVLSSFLSLSHITEQQANEWASKQLVQGGTNTNFKKPELLQALADAYRLSQGRIGAMQIEKKTDNRAHTVVEIGIRAMSPGKDFNRKVLFHEFGHHLEPTGATRIPGREFVKGRSDDGIVHKLSKLQPGSGYSPHEVAYKGNFIDEYVGRIYDLGHGELYSMGFECFSDPVLFMAAYEKDHEHMAFMAGFLISEPSVADIIINDRKDKYGNDALNSNSDFDGAMKKLISYAGQSSPESVDNSPIYRKETVKKCFSYDIDGNKLVLFTDSGITLSNRRSDKVYKYIVGDSVKSLHTPQEKEALAFVGLIRASVRYGEATTFDEKAAFCQRLVNNKEHDMFKEKIIEMASKI